MVSGINGKRDDGRVNRVLEGQIVRLKRECPVRVEVKSYQKVYQIRHAKKDIAINS